MKKPINSSTGQQMTRQRIEMLEDPGAPGLLGTAARLCKKGVMLGVFVLLVGSGRTLAAPITYTLSGTGTGSLGENLFSNTLFTITSTADTSGIMNPLMGIFRVPNITADVFVSGLGTATFTIPTVSVDNQNVVSVGIGAPDQNYAILFANNNPAFASYDLSTSLGPLTGSPTFTLLGFGTTAGNFSLTSASTLIFQAVLVPEPSVLALFCFGAIGLVARLVQQRKDNS